MLKRLFLLLGVLCIHKICGLEESAPKAGDEPKLDNDPYGVADAIKTTKELIEGQRQKRFYDYSYVGYNTGSSAFSSLIPTYPNHDTHSTVPNEQKRLNDILRRLEHIADLTRVFQAPPTQRKPQIPIFIPFPVPQGCTCPPAKPGAPVTKTPPDTKPPPVTKPPPTYLPPDTKPPEKGTMMPDLGNRSGEGDASTKPNVSDDDYDDGVRPISFDPIPPKGPQSVVPPPVEHGSFQAGLDPEPPGSSGPPPPPSTSRPPAAGRPPAVAAPPQVDAPPSPPSVCDGAILACCHRQEVTYDCFAREGCGELEYDNPCDAKVLLDIVNKFRTHFKARG